MGPRAELKLPGGVVEYEASGGKPIGAAFASREASGRIRACGSFAQAAARVALPRFAPHRVSARPETAGADGNVNTKIRKIGIIAPRSGAFPVRRGR